MDKRIKRIGRRGMVLAGLAWGSTAILFLVGVITILFIPEEYWEFMFYLAVWNFFVMFCAVSHAIFYFEELGIYEGDYLFRDDDWQPDDWSLIDIFRKGA